MSIVKQSIIIASLNWSLIPLGVLTSAIIARVIGPEGVGIIALLAGIVGFINSIGGFGLGHSFVYYYKNNIYSIDKLSTVIITNSGFITLLTIIIAVLFSDKIIEIFFHGTQNYNINILWIYLAYSSIPLALLFSIFNTILVVDNQMKLYASRRFLEAIVKLLFILTLFSFGLRVTGVLLSNLIVFTVPVIIFWIWCNNNNLYIKPVFSKEVFYDLYRTGRRQYGVTLSAIITKRISVFLIALYLTIEHNGYYAIALGLMNICMNLPKSTMWPLVGNLIGEDNEIKGEAIAQATRVLFLLMISLGLVLWFTSHYLIYYIYGENFITSSDIFRLLIPTLVSSAIVTPGNAYYNSIGKPGRILPYLILTLLLYVTLLIILIPIIDIRGAAIALSIKQSVLGFIFLLLLRKQTGIPIKEFLIFSANDIKIIYQLILGKIGKIQKRLNLKGFESNI